MQAHADFVFHLEEPREQFATGRKRVRGWIAATGPVANLRVTGIAASALQFQERADVRRAYPSFPFATGFIGEIAADDFRDGSVRLTFDLRGELCEVVEPIAAAPSPPSWLRRTWAKVSRAIALRRLGNAKDAPTRWHAVREALLLEIEIARGADFRREEAERLIALFAEHFPEAHVVQIGAAEGALGDPLIAAFSTTNWSGLLVEPVPHLCAELRERYRDRANVRIEQAAVSTRDGETPFYRLRVSPETPRWYGHLGSLNRDLLLQHRGAIPEIESLIVEERTPTIRLETLLARHEIERIDLMVIDTEGHDFEILRQLDFSRFQPLLLLFEHQHLSPTDKAAAHSLLHAHSYVTREMPEGDTIAWQKG